MNGLESYLFPDSKIGNQNKINEMKIKILKNDYTMKLFYCTLHYSNFWRDIKNEYGNCSFCRMFNKKIHVPLNKEYMKGVDRMAWQEQEGMNFKDWEKEGEEVMGKLKEKLENFGENNSDVYIIEQENGKIVSVWGTGFLTNLMKEVKDGDKIKIVYEGLGKPSKKGFSPPKLFKVFIDR